jgi:hypothetical protein
MAPLCVKKMTSYVYDYEKPCQQHKIFGILDFLFWWPQDKFKDQWCTFIKLHSIICRAQGAIYNLYFICCPLRIGSCSSSLPDNVGLAVRFHLLLLARTSSKTPLHTSSKTLGLIRNLTQPEFNPEITLVRRSVHTCWREIGQTVMRPFINNWPIL